MLMLEIMFWIPVRVENYQLLVLPLRMIEAKDLVGKDSERRKLYL